MNRILGTETPSGKVMVSKKIVYGVALTVIIVSAIILIYFSSPWKPSSTSDVESTNNVEIVLFERGVMYGLWVGEIEYFAFTLEVQNFGNNGVSGLILTVNVIGDSNELYRDSRCLGTLEAGHSIATNMTFTGFAPILRGKDISHVATLISDNVVIDEATLP